MNSEPDTYQNQILAYHADLQTDYETGRSNWSVTLHKTLHGDASHPCIEAMELELSQLIKEKT